MSIVDRSLPMKVRRYHKVSARSAGQNPRATHTHTCFLAACRQAGVELAPLRHELPLFDGVTGAAVQPDMDAHVERLRDALLDAARARVDYLGEAEV